jgi:hypothetical protein
MVGCVVQLQRWLIGSHDGLDDDGHHAGLARGSDLALSLGLSPT